MKKNAEVKVAPHIYRTSRGGWRVYVRRGGKLKPIRFGRDATLEELQHFVETFKVESERLQQEQRAKAIEDAGTFARDAAKYLALKSTRALVSFEEVERFMKFWVAEFGRRPRNEITARDINERLQALEDSGKAGSTVNKYRATLMALWTRLDGRGAANPVRESSVFEEAEQVPRGQDYELLTRILDEVSATRSRPVKGQEGSRDTGSMSRARLALMVWTGMAPSQIMLLKEGAHFSLEQRWYTTPRRQKGRKGRFPRPVIRKPMTADALEAFRGFVQVRAGGEFDRRSLRHTWLRAVKRVEKSIREERKDPKFKLPRIRLYDIRHSFATELYRQTRSLDTVAEMLDHASLRTTRRYALGGVGDVLIDAMTKFEASTTRTRVKAKRAKPTSKTSKPKRRRSA